MSTTSQTAFIINGIDVIVTPCTVLIAIGDRQFRMPTSLNVARGIIDAAIEHGDSVGWTHHDDQLYWYSASNALRILEVREAARRAQLDKEMAEINARIEMGEAAHRDKMREIEANRKGR